MSGILGHRGLLLGAVASVAFVAASGAAYVSGATSINSPSTPAGVANGDGVFAIVYARSALTPPEGWTLVASKTNTDTLTQTIYVYRKDTVTTADAATAFTWSQSASGRMGLGYLVVRSSSGAITVAASSTAETDYATATAYPHNVTIPVMAASVDGELFIIAATSLLATPSPDNDTWAAASGTILRTTATQPENRLVAATQGRNNGQSNATPMTYAIAAGGSGSNYYSAITVRLQP